MKYFVYLLAFLLSSSDVSAQVATPCAELLGGALAESRPRQKIALCSEFLYRCDPRDGLALSTRAEAYWALGEHALAADDYDRASGVLRDEQRCRAMVLAVVAWDCVVDASAPACSGQAGLPAMPSLPRAKLAIGAAEALVLVRADAFENSCPRGEGGEHVLWREARIHQRVGDVWNRNRVLCRIVRTYPFTAAASKAKDLAVPVVVEKEGIGVVISKRGGSLRVFSTAEDGPAARAGLAKGDVIARIDGVATASISIQEATHRLEGAAGSSVALELERGGRTEAITIVRDRVKTETPACAFEW